MSVNYPTLADLSGADRRLLEAWLAEFDRDWTPGQLATRVRDLPLPGQPLRFVALLELVRIDLRRHWQQGVQMTVESYLLSYPELGNRDTAPVELLEAEFT